MDNRSSKQSSKFPLPDEIFQIVLSFSDIKTLEKFKLISSPIKTQAEPVLQAKIQNKKRTEALDFFSQYTFTGINSQNLFLDYEDQVPWGIRDKEQAKAVLTHLYNLLNCDIEGDANSKVGNFISLSAVFFNLLIHLYKEKLFKYRFCQKNKELTDNEKQIFNLVDQKNLAVLGNFYGQEIDEFNDFFMATSIYFSTGKIMIEDVWVDKVLTTEELEVILKICNELIQGLVSSKPFNDANSNDTLALRGSCIARNENKFKLFSTSTLEKEGPDFTLRELTNKCIDLLEKRLNSLKAEFTQAAEKQYRPR